MLLRNALGVGMLLSLMSGCRDPKGACEQQSDCQVGSFCEEATQLCFAYSADQQYEQVEVMHPATGTAIAGGATTIRARVVPKSSVSNPRLPESLTYSVVRASNGEEVGTGSLSKDGADTYSGQWTSPDGEDEYRLTAKVPDEDFKGVSTFVVDSALPQLELRVPAYARAAAGNTTYVDPGATSLPGAWPRDESVTVVVRASEPLSEANLIIEGFNAAGDLHTVPVTPSTEGCDTGYCGVAVVELWKPKLNGFRGSFAVKAEAKDRAGNTATTDGRINVTRWKWAFAGAAGAVTGTPAIGATGRVYFGTTDSTGRVFAVDPGGAKRWDRQLGAIEGSPAVGQNAAGREVVYVGSRNGSSQGALHALDGSGSGERLVRCPSNDESVFYSGPVSTSVGLAKTKLNTEPSEVETAAAIANGSRLVAVRPDAAVDLQCVAYPLTAAPQSGASVLSDGSDFYFGDQRAVRAYRLTDGGWSPKPDFTAPTTTYVVGGLGFSADKSKVFGAGADGSNGEVFAFDSVSGANLWRFPTGGSPVSPVRNVIAASNDLLHFGQDTLAGSDLTTIPLSATAASKVVPVAGGISGAGVLGAGGILYVAASSKPSEEVLGQLTAWSAATLTPLWKLEGSIGLVKASLAIDCARDSSGTAIAKSVGTLYAASLDGKLHAFVVDSPGLDDSAPWPKHQRDPRNSGNVSSDLRSFACPL